jgi:hypothetical protein
MVRPFDIRDVGLMQRLQSQARPLATQMIVVGGISPLRDAMRAYVAAGRDPLVCLVEHDTEHEIDAFGMLQVLPDESSAEVARQRGAAMLLAAPVPHTEAQVHAWLYLIQELAANAAERGAHHIVADVHEGGIEYQILQSAGFAPLMQQDLMKLTRALPADNHAAPVPGLREATKEDEPQIRALHIRSAPKMIYQAECSLDSLLSLLRVQKGWVLVQHNEVVGHIGIWHGRRGRAMRCLFRPEAESQAAAVLGHVLSHDNYRRATYCSVRHYQSWLLHILDELGFAHLTTTTVMMRHSAPRVQAPVWSAVPELEALMAGARGNKPKS